MVQTKTSVIVYLPGERHEWLLEGPDDELPTFLEALYFMVAPQDRG